jgi:hypothetical protein
MKFLNDIKTSPFVPSRARGYSYIAIFKGELADGRYKLSQRGVDPVIATVCLQVRLSLQSKTLWIVTRFAIRLSCDVLEPFLDLLPVHHVPPIGNVFGSLVVVLEIIRVFPHIETQNWQLAV